MELLEDEDLSSISLESISNSIDESQLNIISKELSSLSHISANIAPDEYIAREYSNSDINKLKAKLKQHAIILHQEVKLYEEMNRKEITQQKDFGLPEELIKQLQGIKFKIEDLKNKLKGSEELVNEKDKENAKLKEELRILEIKNFIGNDKYVACKNCIIT